MWSTKRQVEAGDMVIVYLTRDLLQPLTVIPGKNFNSKFGNYRHSDFIGIPYGSKVAAPAPGRGFVYILRPTPELWTLALPHRTQILYLADIAFVGAYLGVRRGSRVVEAGTGSASFSHSVARAVGREGRLFSYEFHEARFRKAKEEFEHHGMADIVSIHHRNVCKDGFTITDEADAVFLDLPAPWEAIPHSKKALRKDTLARICCFSPCLEQVLRTVTALNDAGFSEITTYETLLRPIEVFQTPALPDVCGAAEKLKLSERRREMKRLRQVKANKARRAGIGGKRKRGDGEASIHGEEEADEHEEATKRVRMDGEGGMDIDADINDESEAGVDPEFAVDLDVDVVVGEEEDALPPEPLQVPAASSSPVETPTPTMRRINVSKAPQEVRGHTSYLTFAVLVPVPPFTLAGAGGTGVDGVASANGSTVEEESK